MSTAAASWSKPAMSSCRLLPSVHLQAAVHMVMCVKARRKSRRSSYGSSFHCGSRTPEATECRACRRARVAPPAGGSSFCVRGKGAHERLTVVTRHRNSPFSCRYLVTNCRKNCGEEPTSGALPRPPAATSKNAASVVLASSPAKQEIHSLRRFIRCTTYYRMQSFVLWLLVAGAFNDFSASPAAGPQMLAMLGFAVTARQDPVRRGPQPARRQAVVPPMPMAVSATAMLVLSTGAAGPSTPATFTSRDGMICGAAAPLSRLDPCLKLRPCFGTVSKMHTHRAQSQ